MTDYSLIGNYTVVPVADLQNLVSKVNVPNGDTRFHATGFNKSAGYKVLADLTGGVYARVVALGSKSSSIWSRVDGVQYTPVNILTPGGQTNWTITQTTAVDDGTYVAGVLTQTAAKTAMASQVVILKAGKYRIVGTVDRTTTTKAAKLTVTAATDGVVVNNVFSKSTVSADNSVVDSFTLDFTLTTASQNVTFANNIVAVSGLANSTGSAFIKYSLEALDS